MKKRILITNDDGVASPGLTGLVGELLRAGCDLRVVAPEKEQSGVGHCLTIHWPLYAEQYRLPEPISEVPAYHVSGTPADCVKLALNSLYPDFKPDMVISGINRGPNVGTSVLYSGTVAGAMEACLAGVPAIALSLAIPENGLWHFALAAELAVPMVLEALERGIPPWTILNINFPNRSQSEIKGVKLARHGRSGFQEYYVEEAQEKGRRRFRLEGNVVYRENTSDYDGTALREGWITVTPLGTSWECDGGFLKDWRSMKNE